MSGAADVGADVIVVGAGSSGSVVAERLSRDPDRRVLWLEAGPGSPGPSALRLDRLPIGPGSDRVARYRSRQGFDLPRGRGVGGSSVVNGGYFLRWHRSDFTGWCEEIWPMPVIADTYDSLDGGAQGGGSMHVSAFADDEIGAYAEAFESHWESKGLARVEAPWTDLGINRVRSNRDGPLRRSAAHWMADDGGRPGLRLLTGAAATELVVRGGRVRGVAVGDDVFTADEVIVCAGTLGTAELLIRSPGVQIQSLDVWEHREVLVRFGPASLPVAKPPALLQSVVHTSDGVELRCYGGDFADFIDGLPVTGPAFGAALMRPHRAGSLSWDATHGLQVDLGELDGADTRTLGVWAERLRAMFESDHFAACAEKGSAQIDPVLRTSQHAWGTLPMGVATDWAGAVNGLDGLRVIDASILPTAGSSGPHATVMMVATRIVDLIY
ncbi:mycofactocin system GMC family oxidoreductase MftG [Williamsia sp. R60]